MRESTIPASPGSDWLTRPGFKVFWDAPVVVIISGPVGDCCRAGQNFMLSAHARGLGSCWVGSPMLWLSTPEVRAELKIPSDLPPVAVLCLGYPAEVPRRSFASGHPSSGPSHFPGTWPMQSDFLPLSRR